MTGNINRWYTKEVFSELDYNQAEAFFMDVDAPEPPDVQGDDGAFFWDPQVSRNMGRPPRSYYQIIVRKPISALGKDNLPFDPAKFQETDWVLNHIKAPAAKTLSDNITGSENESALNIFLMVLKNNAYVTHNFYIEPGDINAGSLIYFQVLFSLGTLERNALPKNESELNEDEEPDSSTSVEYNAFEFMSSNNEENILLKMINTLQVFEEKNKNLTEKWNFSFMGLAAEVKHLHDLLNETFYGTIAPPPTRNSLWESWNAALATDATGKPLDPSRLASEKTMIPLESIKFSFSTSDAEQAGTEQAATAAVSNSALNTKIAQILVAIPTPDFKNRISRVFYNSAAFNQEYGSELKYILKRAKEIENYINPQKNPSGAEIDDFVNKFINPIPQKTAAPVAAEAVYNSGEARYKTKEDTQSEVLTNAQKEQIFVKVLQSFNQDLDQIFLDILSTAGSKIKTTDEIFKVVLDRIPIQNVITVASKCLLKYIPQTSLKEMVCDAILERIDPSQIEDLIKYMSSNVDTLPDSEIKDYLLNIESGFYQSKSDIRLQLQALFGQSITEKDILCTAVFVAIPAAHEMLKSLENLEFPEGGITIPTKIENPFEGPIKKLGDTYEKYENMALTADWAAMIERLIISLAQEIIVQTVSFILDQIRELCEGSSKADFANLPADKGQMPGYNPAINPFSPATINEAVTDPSIYNDLANDFDLNEVDLNELFQDFLDDLGRFLTLSEMCILLSSGVRSKINQKNLKLILDKVWDGILSTEKYLPLKKAFKTKSNLKKLFFVLSKKVDQSYCVDKLAALDNTKKLLSELCAPVSNQALIDNLSDKATEAAIQDLLKQDNDINRSFVDALAKLKNPIINVPPVFCGPDAEKDSFNAPLFESQTHPSQKYLNNLSQNNAMRGVERAFETDISKYKSILTNSDDNFGDFAKIHEATTKVAGMLAGLYGNDEISVPASLGGKFNKDSANTVLNDIIKNNNIVAEKVYTALTDSNNSIKVDGATDSDFVQINAPSTAGDIVNLKINFADSVQNEVPEKTSRMEFGMLVSQKHDSKIDFDGTPGEALENLINEDIGSPQTGNDFAKLVYNPYLLKDVKSQGTRFYSLILNQIIREHAEFITTKNLFQRNFFETLKVEKENTWETSLLNYKDILNEIPANVELLECLINFYDVPNANDICQMNAYIELIVKTIVIKEFLRGLMVFSVYGINALLPESDDFSKPLSEQSPYYQYMIGQINNKLSFNDISSLKSIKCSDGLDSTAFKKIVYDYSSVIYAAKQAGQPKKEQIGDSQTVINLTLQEIIIRQFANVQKQFFANNPTLKEKGILQYELDLVEGKGGPVGSGGSPAYASNHILQNIVATHVIQDAFGDNVTIHKYFDPPTIEEIDKDGKTIVIPSGFYSDNERLSNGGFFLEKGFEVSRKHKGDPGAFTKEDYGMYQSKMDPHQKGAADNPDYADSTIYTENAGGVASKDYITKFNQVIFGHKHHSGFAFRKELDKLSQLKVMERSSWEGKLPYARQADFKDIFNSIMFWGSPDNDQFISMGIADNNGGAIKNADFYNPFIGDPNKLFKTFNSYISLNLLIPVSQQGTGEEINFMQEAYDNIKILTAAHNPGAFYETVWGRKYFVREGVSGRLFLKIPLLTFYDRKNSVDSLAALGAASNKSLTEIREENGSPLKEEAPLPGTTLFGFNLIATDQRFKDFVRLIEYKPLLSFIAILVSEMIENKYPKIESMFDNTLDVLITVLNTLEGINNRNNDSNFYQIPSIDPDAAANSGMDLDLMSLVFNLLIKMLANMSDPTWKTPWFLPGPLTPFGIIAKILEAIADGDSDSMAEVAKGLANKQAEIDNKECSDEGNS